MHCLFEESKWRLSQVPYILSKPSKLFIDAESHSSPLRSLHQLLKHTCSDAIQQLSNQTPYFPDIYKPPSTFVDTCTDQKTLYRAFHLIHQVLILFPQEQLKQGFVKRSLKYFRRTI